jgi:ubiquitin carboxyl-terminal hydrolase 48
MRNRASSAIHYATTVKFLYLIANLLFPPLFSALGEHHWMESDSSCCDEEEELEEIEIELSMERRETNLPAGLKNLGNTCYVNSFLQIWFHNVQFRQALYDWEPGEDKAERENYTLLQAEQYEPVGTVATLQALFSMMEFTNRRAVDPSALIAKLALDPLVQQGRMGFTNLTCYQEFFPLACPTDLGVGRLHIRFCVQVGVRFRV